MAEMTATQLLDKAAQCIRCHQVHEEWLAPAHPVRGDKVLTTAAADGHPYSPLLDESMIARLRELIPAPSEIGLTYAEQVELGSLEPSPATWVADEVASPAGEAVAADSEPEPVKTAAKRTRSRTAATKTAS